MKRKRFSVEQIVAVLKQAEVGVPVAELIRQVGISEQTLYRWKKQYKGLETDQVRQFKQLQEENGQLKRLVAELTSFSVRHLPTRWRDRCLDRISQPRWRVGCYVCPHPQRQRWPELPSRVSEGLQLAFRLLFPAATAGTIRSAL